MKKHFTISSEEEGQRLDLLLTKKISKFSRSQVKKIIETDSVKRNGQIINSASQKVKAGDSLNIDFTNPERATIDIEKIYEDDNLLAINKPARVLTTDETFLSREPTIEDSLLREYDEIEIVHRLDKDTSGVLLVAKNIKTKQFLQTQFKNRTVQKHYVALVEGKPKHKKAKLNWPIARHPQHPLKWRVSMSGRNSITNYEIIEPFTDKTLLDVFPETGRTHQIRVHLAHLGNPVTCDALYGTACKKLDRHFLHARSITIAMPFDEKIKSFDVPIPRELKIFLDRLK